MLIDDFDSTALVQTISISATTTFTGSNYAAGKSITLFITTDGSERDLAFPAGWIFRGNKAYKSSSFKNRNFKHYCVAVQLKTSVRCAYAVEE